MSCEESRKTAVFADWLSCSRRSLHSLFCSVPAGVLPVVNALIQSAVAGGRQSERSDEAVTVELVREQRVVGRSLPAMWVVCLARCNVGKMALRKTQCAVLQCRLSVGDSAPPKDTVVSDQ